MAEDVTKEYVKEEESGTGFVEGFALSGAEVAGAKNKKFEILQEPFYEVFEDMEGKVKRKLKLWVRFNEAEVSYYPNNTSQGKIIAERGRRLKDWVGFKGEFEVLQQKVGNEKKNVIYVKE